MTNTGTGRLTVGAATIGGADPSQFSISSDTCSGRRLAAGGACSLQVAFGPSSAGAKTATLTVPSNDALSPDAAGLSGTATAAPAVRSPRSVPPRPADRAEPRAVADRAGHRRVNVAVSGPGTLNSTVRATIGSTTVRIPSDEVVVSAPGTVRVRLELPAKVRARLAAAGKVPVSVTSVLTGAGGSATSTVATTLRAPPSQVLRGQWIARVLGPWRSVPTMGARVRSALRFDVDGAHRWARVVR